MSAIIHNKNEKEFLGYIANILNIELSNLIFIADMENELKKIDDLAKFVSFIKEKFNYSKYEFKTGEQKLILLIKDYKEEVMYKLSDDVEQKVYDSSKKLYEQSVYFFHEVNFLIQNENRKIDLEATINNLVNGFTKKQATILNFIGYKEAFRLALYNQNKLESEIIKTVRKLTKAKQFKTLMLEITEKYQDKKVLERIQAAK